MSRGETVKISGKSLICHHCQCDTFDRRSAVMEGTFESLVTLDLFFRKVVMFVCTNCGHVHFFSYPEVQTSEKQYASQHDLSEPTDCLSCGARIPAGSATCASCGWTYTETEHRS